jgi:hypothetical protein
MAGKKTNARLIGGRLLLCQSGSRSRVTTSAEITSAI